MKIYYFYVQQNQSNHPSIFMQDAPLEGAKHLFTWLDCTLTDLKTPDQWQEHVFNHTQLAINEYHIEDIYSPEHPSSYDTTEEYDLLIFRKLITPDDGFVEKYTEYNNEKILMFNPSEIITTPTSFIISDNALITIRDERNQAAKLLVERLTQLTHPQNSKSKNLRVPSSPLDLTLKLLNTVIDRYLDIRLPLTQRVSYWQNQLLQNASQFNRWQDLFQENMALQQIEYLCEEQIDVLRELRDDIMENQTQLESTTLFERQDITLVRMNDLLSHVERVQNHVTRLESMIRTAIDLHFSAVSNQTNENMRILAIITAIFSPLTLLTGIYGMNFESMPGLTNPYGFWIMLAVMIFSTLILLYLFRKHNLVGTGRSQINQTIYKNPPPSLHKSDNIN